jgi:hypothetical protein
MRFGHLPPQEWALITERLRLSQRQATFLWHALYDSRDTAIAERMSLSLHGAHAHRMAVFRKLRVDSMPAAIGRVFEAYVSIRNGGAIGENPPSGAERSSIT